MSGLRSPRALCNGNGDEHLRHHPLDSFGRRRCLDKRADRRLSCGAGGPSVTNRPVKEPWETDSNGESERAPSCVLCRAVAVNTCTRCDRALCKRHQHGDDRRCNACEQAFAASAPKKRFTYKEVHFHSVYLGTLVIFGGSTLVVLFYLVERSLILWLAATVFVAGVLWLWAFINGPFRRLGARRAFLSERPADARGVPIPPEERS